jgi:hypothetical protein
MGQTWDRNRVKGAFGKRDHRSQVGPEPSKVYFIRFESLSQALVAHACNPSYSGGRDQEDRSLKPARANSLRDPILKNPSQK